MKASKKAELAIVSDPEMNRAPACTSDVAASPSGVRIVIVAHAPLASAFVQAAADVYPGAQNMVTAYDYRITSDRESALRALLADLRRCLAPGWIVMCDLSWWASPGVVASELGDRLGSLGCGARLLCGLNMAMLLTAVSSVEGDIDSVWRASEDAGRESVLAALPQISEQVVHSVSREKVAQLCERQYNNHVNLASSR